MTRLRRLVTLLLAVAAAAVGAVALQSPNAPAKVSLGSAATDAPTARSSEFAPAGRANNIPDAGSEVWYLFKENDFIIREGPAYDYKKVAQIDLAAGSYSFAAHFYARSTGAQQDLACIIRGPGVTSGGWSAMTLSPYTGWQELSLTGVGQVTVPPGHAELWCSRSTTNSESVLRGVFMSATTVKATHTLTQP